MRGGDAGRVVVSAFLCALLIGGWPRSAAGDAVLVSDVGVSQAAAEVGGDEQTDSGPVSASAGVSTPPADASANAANLSGATGPIFSSLWATVTADASTLSNQPGTGVYAAGRGEATRTIDFTLNDASGYSFDTMLSGTLGQGASSLLASVTLLEVSGSPDEVWKHSLDTTNPLLELNAAGTLEAGSYRLLFSAMASSANGPVGGPFPAEWNVVTESTVFGVMTLGAPPVVPLPAAAMAGLVLIGGIAGARRRCR